MRHGYLSEYFKGVAVKTLSPVEVNVAISHQHEFNGVNGLKQLLGDIKRTFAAKCVYLTDVDDNPVFEDISLTWYDARENHPVRSEWRLYFKPCQALANSISGDTLFICRTNDDNLLLLITEQDSTIEKQMLWLFGIGDSSSPAFTVKSTLETEQDRLHFASRLILEKIGITPEEEDTNLLDVMLERFNGTFPGTYIFSEFARSTLPDISGLDNPDMALLAWMEQEEILFRTLEKHLIADRLQKGFTDNDDFFKFSISALNRRKARAGLAFENHVEVLLQHNGIVFSRTPMTENRKKPDFIFPNISCYNNRDFPVEHLTMLGVKTTSKDRWRQVCTEADRITQKHLLTLEPRISINQTEEMTAANLTLVVPEEIKNTYTEEFDEYMKKYTVTKPEYADEENSEGIYEKLFGVDGD